MLPLKSNLEHSADYFGLAGGCNGSLLLGMVRGFDSFLPHPAIPPPR